MEIRFDARLCADPQHLFRISSDTDISQGGWAATQYPVDVYRMLTAHIAAAFRRRPASPTPATTPFPSSGDTQIGWL